jgi:hypothetical protein
MVLLGVARANTSVGESPEIFLLPLLAIAGEGSLHAPTQHTYPSSPPPIAHALVGAKASSATSHRSSRGPGGVVAGRHHRAAPKVASVHEPGARAQAGGAAPLNKEPPKRLPVAWRLATLGMPPADRWVVGVGWGNEDIGVFMPDQRRAGVWGGCALSGKHTKIVTLPGLPADCLVVAVPPQQTAMLCQPLTGSVLAIGLCELKWSKWADPMRTTLQTRSHTGPPVPSRTLTHRPRLPFPATTHSKRCAALRCTCRAAVHAQRHTVLGLLGRTLRAVFADQPGYGRGLWQVLGVWLGRDVKARAGKTKGVCHWV